MADLQGAQDPAHQDRDGASFGGGGGGGAASQLTQHPTN